MLHANPTEMCTEREPLRLFANCQAAPILVRRHQLLHVTWRKRAFHPDRVRDQLRPLLRFPLNPPRLDRPRIAMLSTVRQPISRSSVKAIPLLQQCKAHSGLRPEQSLRNMPSLATSTRNVYCGRATMTSGTLARSDKISQMSHRYIGTVADKHHVVDRVIPPALPNKTIKTLLSTTEPDTMVKVQGWIRSTRQQKNVTFMEVNDGSSLKGVQAILGGGQGKGYVDGRRFCTSICSGFIY